MTDNFDKDKADELVEKMFKHLPSEVEIEVKLPSTGRFYPTKGPVTVRPITWDDEKALASAKRGNIDLLSLILSRCVKGVSSDVLLTMDKLFLFFTIRKISYGSDYTASIMCPKCNSQGEVTVSMDDFHINYVPDDFENPREVTLPLVNQTVTVRWPRNDEQAYLENPEVLSANLWRFVEKVGEHSRLEIRNKFLELLGKKSLKDMHVLIEEINTPRFGVDSRINYHCDTCKESTILEVPLGTDFFTMS